MFKWFKKKNSYSLDHKLKCHSSSFPLPSSSPKPPCTCFSAKPPCTCFSPKPPCTCFPALNPRPSESKSTMTSNPRPSESQPTMTSNPMTCNRSPAEDDVAGSPRTRKVGPPPLKPGVDYVNPGEEDQMEVYGYKSNCLLKLMTWILIISSGGLVRLIFHWRKHWMLICTHSQCTLKEADKLFLVDGYNQIFVERVVRLTSGSESGHHSKRKEDIECYGSIRGRGELVRPRGNGVFEPVDELVYFDSKKMRYIWDVEGERYMKVDSLDVKTECSTFHRLNGLTSQEEEKRRILYGKNEIKVQVQSVLSILFNEVLGPFYVFQVFSIILWSFENYVMYASCIVIMSTLSLVSSVIQIRRNQAQLRDTVEGVDRVSVYKGSVYEETDSVNLVPGDIISIPGYGCLMTCDAVLISGNVIVNESMLTGESVPVTKTPLPDINYRSELYDPKEHAKHTLFCGTRAIQTRYYEGGKVHAVVVRTGFNTAKGDLVRSIMFPKPVDFRFNRHIYRFIQYLAVLAALGFIYTVILKAQRGVSLGDILLKALDLITIIIPPALPMAMTIGVIFAQTRLKQSDIFCISPRSINISGCINCVCFDKTGTLTEDDLSFSQVVPVDPDTRLFGSPVHDVTTLDRDDEHEALLVRCLATCHSLTIIEGSIIGDPLDQKMFAATNWILEEPAVDDTTKFDLLAPTVVKPKLSPAKRGASNGSLSGSSPGSPITGSSDNLIDGQEVEPELEPEPKLSQKLEPKLSQKLEPELSQELELEQSSGSSDVSGEEVGILRQFQFSSSLQRMSVVTRRLNGGSFEVYTKGAPEVILSLCLHSTLPLDFDSILQQYTQKGFRVLALASRPLNTTYVKMQRATREEVETDLYFLGLLVMGNMLKPETTPVIDTLFHANIRTVMVTGDNMLTALSVARECHMIHPTHSVVLLEVDGSSLNCFDEANYSQEDASSDGEGKEDASSDGEGKEDASSDGGGKKPVAPLLTWKFADQITRRDSISSANVHLFKDHRQSTNTPNTQSTNTQSAKSNEQLHIAVTGKTFRVLREFYPSLLAKVAIRGTVFSRMAPDQKQQLIEILQDLGYYVGMCGDGANDCGALKAAHAGLSLSDTEASVASPFTSKQANISCIPILIREGRASLVTAFGILKYMACYSICQFVSVILLYTLWSNLTDFQFLYEDLFLISLFFVVFGRTESFESLAKAPPPSSLIGITPLFSLALQIILIVGFQVFSVLFLWKQSWYIPHVPEDEEDLGCHDNYAVFAVSVFQYITLAVVFSKGSPYRKPIYTNYLFLASLIIMTIFTIYIVLDPHDWAINLFEFKNFSYVDIKFRSIMVLLAVINFFLAFFAESVIVDYLIFIRFKEWLRKMTSSETMFDKIFNSTRTTDWLPGADEVIRFNQDGDSDQDGGSDHDGGFERSGAINSCQLHGSVRFTSSVGRVNGYTNTALDGRVNGYTNTVLDDGEESQTVTGQVETVIDVNPRTKSSPSESGICVISPVYSSAPVSPLLPSPPSHLQDDNKHSMTADLQSNPVYKSISNIPTTFDTNEILINQSAINPSSGKISEGLTNQSEGLGKHNQGLGKHNRGFVRNDSLVLIENEETRNEDSDGRPVLNGNSSDVLI